LVTVVMPAYRNYVLESQRFDTQGKMLQILELQERFYIDQFTYTTALNGNLPAGTGLGYPADPLIINYNGNPAYSIQVATCDDPVIYPDAPGLNRCFRLIATPQGDQVNDGGIVIDNRGRKIHDFASIQPRDWNGNNLNAAACPECAAFPPQIP
jgi:Tfp pilus assembly protein PilE